MTSPDHSRQSLTVEEVAERVGRTPAYFRVLMSKISHGVRDLRAPAQPRERARRYDADKIDN